MSLVEVNANSNAPPEPFTLRVIVSIRKPFLSKNDALTFSIRNWSGSYSNPATLSPGARNSDMEVAPLEYRTKGIASASCSTFGYTPQLPHDTPTWFCSIWLLKVKVPKPLRGFPDPSPPP